MAKHKKRYSVSESLINPAVPIKGKRWYCWVESWSGWKKTALVTFMNKPMDQQLRERLMRSARKKGAPASLLEQIKEPNEQE